MGLLRGKIRWNIPNAGAAYSVMHFDTNSGSTPTQADADEVVAKLAAFVTAIKGDIPPQVTLQVINETEEIVAATGTMLGVYAGPAQTAVPGTAGAASPWAAAAGAVIGWSTAGVRNGRRVRGRTFLVPLSSEAFDTDGTIKTVPLGRLQTAATNLLAQGTNVQLAVYARPTAPGASDGVSFDAVSARVPDMGAILRSRRS
jgi:hypothetical protein